MASFIEREADQPEIWTDEWLTMWDENGKLTESGAQSTKNSLERLRHKFDEEQEKLKKQNGTK